MNNFTMLFYLVMLCIFSIHNTSAQDLPKDSTLVRHVYVCGAAHALDSDQDVRKRLTPYRSVLPMQSSTVAAIRDVPAEKGARLLNYFLDNVGHRFSIGGVENCGISKATQQMVSVSCATTYASGYDKVFFVFEYEHVAESHAKIILEVKQRSSIGRVYPASQVLNNEDQVWFGDMFKSIIEDLLSK